MPKADHNALLSAEHPRRRNHVVSPWACFLVTLAGGFWFLPRPNPYAPDTNSLGSPYGIYHCTPPPIPLEFLGSVERDAPDLGAAFKSLDKVLSRRALQTDMDSLSVAVVTPVDVIFQKQYGTLKANETGENMGRPDGDSLYRLASLSKMFASLEMMILRERGALSLDDPITRFLPNFTYSNKGWADYFDAGANTNAMGFHQPPITFRQLASHTSGLGRDYPKFIIPSYPHVEPNTTVDHEISREKMMHDIASLPLVAEPYTYPIYSNTGFSLLGWALTAAANASSYAELIQKDIFTPLGLGSSFGVTSENAQRVVVSRDPTESDLDLTDATNSAGGQYSSLKDLTAVMQTFLDPRNNKHALLSPYAMREWLRPLYGWDDGYSEVGSPWEIMKIPDTYGIPRRYYSKAGNFDTHHSMFLFDPTRSSYGVIILMTGSYFLSSQIAAQVIQTIQPVFDLHIARAAAGLYSGTWEADNGKSRAVTYVDKGNVWLKTFVLDGEDMFTFLSKFGRILPSGKTRYALWSTGRKDEFRIALGLPEPHDYVLEGCDPAWTSLDGAFGKMAPIDLLLFSGDPSQSRSMRVPSAGVTLVRKK